ncbi:signal recognition particle receptor subunit alpha [Candidatus Parvarchaeota archaeon]|nr:signal recognition particle receptor subunit alpha [Candidatus Parvarchaeota archaeon]
MVFDYLSEKLRAGINKLLNSTGNEKVEEVLSDIQKALIEGDVDKGTVTSLIEKIKKDIKERKGSGFLSKERVLDIIYNDIVEIIGTAGNKIQIDSVPYKILLAGLFGSGKTTTAAKLANYYKKRGYRVLLLGLDTFRPAAYEQLVQLSKQINVKVAGSGKDPQQAIKEASKSFKDFDIIIADSAGRDALDKELVDEIKGIKKTFDPDHVCLVIPADLGQNAKIQVKSFHDLLGIDSIVITKTDGTANGGGALTAAYISGAKVAFIGTGEKIQDIEEFDPREFVSRLLGLEGLESILKKAEEENIKINEESVKNVMKGEFSLMDMYEQYSSTKKLGAIDKITSMIPGLSSSKNRQLVEKQGQNLGRFTTIMDSMTKLELEDPKIINAERIKRIAKGSGQSEELVRELLDQYRKMKTVMKMSKNRQVSNLMKKFGINL